MESSVIPESYEQWRHCILVECGLDLTPDFISQRIASLQDPSGYYTQQFIRCYGAEYLTQVIGWFKRAQQAA